jgi:predicted MFS family arabinose efflux permease
VSPPRSSLRDYRHLDPRIWVLAGARAANTMGLGAVMSFLAIYLVRDRGLSGAQVGTLYLVANLLQAWAQTWAGALSDHHGRRRIMVGALLGRVVLVSLLGALVLHNAPVWAMGTTVIASWTVRGCFEPVAYAAVADVAGPEQRVAAFGLQKVGVNVGWALGPAIGGMLAASIGYGWVFFCSAPVVLVSAIAVTAVRDAPRPRPARRPRAPLRQLIAETRARPTTAVFLGCALLVGVAHTQLFSPFSLHAESLGFPERVLGRFWLVNGVLVVALQAPAIALIDRFGRTRALLAGAGLYATSFFALAGATSALAVTAAIAVLTAGEVLVHPAMQATAAELGDGARMGRVFGLVGTLEMLGIAIAPMLGGLAFDAFRSQPGRMWIVLAAFPAALTLGYAVFARALRREREATRCSGRPGSPRPAGEPAPRSDVGEDRSRG